MASRMAATSEASLTSAELLDTVGSRLPVQGRRQVPQRLHFAHGNATALEADGAEVQFVEHCGDGVGELLHGRANDCLQAGTLLGNLLDVAKIADEKGAVSRQDEDAAVAAEARQVGDVDDGADQQRGNLFGGQQRSQSLAALRKSVMP